MPKSVTRVELIYNAALVENFYLAGSHNIKMIEGVRSCSNYNSAMREIFDFNLSRNSFQIKRGERIKGRLLGKEIYKLLHFRPLPLKVRPLLVKHFS